MIGKWHSRLIRNDGAMIDDGEFNLADIVDNPGNAQDGTVRTAQHTLGGQSANVTGSVSRTGDGFRFSLQHVDFGSTTGALRNYGAVLVLNGPLVPNPPGPPQPMFSMLVGRMNQTDGRPLQKTKGEKAVVLSDQLDGTVVITRP
jgi:hypothetical protein